MATTTTNKYSLVETHIDYVRVLLREDSDDSYFTDEIIYKALLDARSLVIERRVLKGKQMPDDLYQTICMPLCIDNYHDCECVAPDLGCKVLKTQVEVPRAFFNGAQDLMRVSTLWGEEIAPSNESKSRYRKYKKTNTDAMYYVRVNNRLALFNRLPKPLKVIKITAIFEDPATLVTFNSCESGDCYDVLGTGFGTKASDNFDMYQIVKEVLLKTKMTPDDRTNNAEGVAKEQIF